MYFPDRRTRTMGNAQPITNKCGTYQDFTSFPEFFPPGIVCKKDARQIERIHDVFPNVLTT
ncbi:hypothetical protein [Thiobacillus sp.]